eukprot:gene49732-15026_t
MLLIAVDDLPVCTPLDASSALAEATHARLRFRPMPEEPSAADTEPAERAGERVGERGGDVAELGHSGQRRHCGDGAPSVTNSSVRSGARSDTWDGLAAAGHDVNVVLTRRAGEEWGMEIDEA